MSASKTKSPPVNLNTAGAAAPASPYTQFTDAARAATSRASYFAAALRIAAEACGSPYAAYYVRNGAEVLQDAHHRGPTDPRFWKDRVDRLLTECLGESQTRAALLSARNAELRVAIAAVPVANAAANVHGAIALVLPLFDDEPRVRVAILEAQCAVIASAAALVGAGAALPPGTANAGATATALARAATFDTVEALAFNLTNNLRNKLGCEQVALGLARGAHVRIVSISGLDDVKAASPGVTRLRAAMEECLDAAESIAYPTAAASGDGPTAHYRLHGAWRESIGAAAVASIPLSVGDRVTAVISLRRRGDEPFSAEQLAKIRAQVEPFAPALQLVQRASRSAIRHALDSLCGAACWLIEPGRHGRKALAGLAAATALWFCFGKMSYELTVPSAVVPAESRHISAPFGALLSTAGAVAGDRVKAGDVLCVLDSRELELQRGEIAAQRAVAEQEHALALAANKPVEARVAELNERFLLARLATLDQRIAESVVRSPIDGVVVSGDLRARVGAVLAQGDPLFEVAPLTHWHVELAVPEHAACGLAVGVEGAFANHARPEHSQAFKVSRVRPRAEVKDGHNVYIAEADARLEGDWLRPGMEGMSKVQLGTRPVWWIALHHVVDYLHLNFWI